MTTKGPTITKTKCPKTAKDATCGVDELAADVKAMRAEIKALQVSIDKLWHGANLENFATVAKQLVNVPATLEKVQALLKSVLADRAEGHEAINQLRSEMKEVKAWQTLHEAGHGGSANGSMRP